MTTATRFSRRNDETHPGGWVSVPTARALARLGRRSDAARAVLDLFRTTVFDDRHRLNIRIETPAGFVVTETHIIAERRAFATVSTFCHIAGPPENFLAQSACHYSIWSLVSQPHQRSF